VCLYEREGGEEREVKWERRSEGRMRDGGQRKEIGGVRKGEGIECGGQRRQ
jgi:hypothetical protein